jgi:hypothetical protein
LILAYAPGNGMQRNGTVDQLGSQAVAIAQAKRLAQVGGQAVSVFEVDFSRAP